MRMVLLLVCLGVCVGGCGPDEETKQSAADHVDVYLEAGRKGDYETIWFLIHPDDKAFYTWNVSLAQLQFLLFEAEDKAAVKADIDALETKHGVRKVEDTEGAATPNPASMDAVIEHATKMLEGVNHLALIKDAVALFEAYEKPWNPFHEFDKIEIERVDVFEDGALAVFKGDPEPRIWLSPVEGAWFIRYRPPPLVVVENWQREFGPK